MSRISILLLLFISSLVSACAILLVELTPDCEYLIAKSYKIGDIYKSPVGSVMIRLDSLKVYTRPSFTPIFDYQPPTANLQAMPQLKVGQQWQAVWTTPGEDGYVLRNLQYDRRLAIRISRDGKVTRGWIDVSNNATPLQGHWTKEQLFGRLEQAAQTGQMDKGSFAAELVYSGVSQHTVGIVYREYTNELARPAFFQELTYDLSESNNIKFRSLVLEIHEANNSYIEFRVVDDGDLPWYPKEEVMR